MDHNIDTDLVAYGSCKLGLSRRNYLAMWKRSIPNAHATIPPCCSLGVNTGVQFLALAWNGNGMKMGTPVLAHEVSRDYLHLDILNTHKQVAQIRPQYSLCLRGI